MTELLTVIMIIFIIAGPFLLLANHLRLPTAPALIVAGLIAGYFVDETLKLDVARLGIALLVFTFAVRIQTTDIKTAVADSEKIAFVQIGTLWAFGFGSGLLLALPPDQAIYLGIVAALSSSVVGSTLFLPGKLDVVHDRISESIHAVQDFVGLFFLLAVSAGTLMFDPIATQFGYGVLLLLLAVAINRYLFDLVGRFTRGSDEAMLVGTIALLLLFLGLAESIGLSIVVGAFAAGIAVRDDLVQYSGIINGLESIYVFFTAIFFITIGALVTIPSADVLVGTLVLVLLVGVVKPAITIAVMIYLGYEQRTATLTGFNLDQVGEFALIIAIEALILGLIFPSVFDMIILAAAITMISASLTRYYDEQIYHRLADRGLLGDHDKIVERWSNVPEPLTDHIVIIGYSRYGSRLVAVCEDFDQSYVVIESNPALRSRLASDCDAYVFGDVIEPSTTEKARLLDARIVISTADERPVNDHLMTFADHVDIIVRTKDMASAREYLNRGAFYVGVTDLLAADHLEQRFADLIDGKYDRDELMQEPIEVIAEFSTISFMGSDYAEWDI